MTGKVLNVSSNDLYGNVDDRLVSVFACFEHTKYMNNYIVFSINNDRKKLCYGSVHFKKKSLVIFNVKESIKQYIEDFLQEYTTDNMKEFNILDISKFEKVELVSFNEMEYDNILLLEDKSIPKVIEKKEEVSHNKKPIFMYLLIFILMLFAIGITVLYFMPGLFTVKYKGILCNNFLYDSNLELYYDIEKTVKFNRNDKLDVISVIRTYTFLDSNSYYDFKNSENHSQYFTNGEGYKYIDNELKFKVFYEENSVIDDFDEMLTYLNREGFSCEVYEYEE